MGAGTVNNVVGILDSAITGIKQSTLKNTRALKMNWELALGHSADDIFNKDWYKKSINKTEKNAENLTKRQAARTESGKATREAVRTGRQSGKPEKESVVQNAINRVSETKEEIAKKTKATKETPTEGGQEFSTFLMDFDNPEAGIKELHYDANTQINYSEDLKNAKKTSDGGFWDNATTWAGEHPIGTAAAIAGGGFGIGLMAGDND